MLTNIILLKKGHNLPKKETKKAEFRKSLLFFIKRIFENINKILLLMKLNQFCVFYDLLEYNYHTQSNILFN